jgi:hypothetical protein
LAFGLENLGLERLRNLDAQVDRDVKERLREHAHVARAAEERVVVLDALVDRLERLAHVALAHRDHEPVAHHERRDDALAYGNHV